MKTRLTIGVLACFFAIGTASHSAAPKRTNPYTRLFMTFVGKIGGPPPDGFGADYDASFFATQIVCAFSQGNCKSDVISLEIPVSFPGNNQMP